MNAQRPGDDLAGCFVDTTILVHATGPTGANRTASETLLKANVPALLCGYALRELLSGRVQAVCDAHNRVLAATDPAAASASLLSQIAFKTRTTAAKLELISQALSNALQGDAQRTPSDIKREVLQSLLMHAMRMWRDAQRLALVQKTQPLSCGITGSLELDSVSGAIRGPQNRFTCSSKERCGAALYLAEKKIDLQKVVEALHPDKLPAALSSKQETKSRRKAIKDLLQSGPKQFSKVLCRALGDAYFAVMSPPGHAIATTNISDYQPLCSALNKSIVQP